MLGSIGIPRESIARDERAVGAEAFLYDRSPVSTAAVLRAPGPAERDRLVIEQRV
jgi:hypothetical protein